MTETYKARDLGPGTVYENYGKPRIPLVGYGQRYSAQVWSTKPGNPWKIGVIVVGLLLTSAVVIPWAVHVAHAAR